MSDDQTIAWLRGLAEKGGKGVVNNIDARCLGRIADDLEQMRAELAIAKAALEKIAAGVSFSSGNHKPDQTLTSLSNSSGIRESK